MGDQLATDDDGPISLGEIRNSRTIAARVADVEAQLAELKADPPAASSSAPVDDGAVQDRLDRQRADIEALKTRYNELVAYLNQQLGGAQ